MSRGATKSRIRNKVKFDLITGEMFPLTRWERFLAWLGII